MTLYIAYTTIKSCFSEPVVRRENLIGGTQNWNYNNIIFAILFVHKIHIPHTKRLSTAVLMYWYSNNNNN